MLKSCIHQPLISFALKIDAKCKAESLIYQQNGFKTLALRPAKRSFNAFVFNALRFVEQTLFMNSVHQIATKTMIKVAHRLCLQQPV
jgi:hypothetical protein